MRALLAALALWALAPAPAAALADPAAICDAAARIGAREIGAPEQVLRFGAAPTSKPLTQWLAAHAADRTVLAISAATGSGETTPACSSSVVSKVGDKTRVTLSLSRTSYAG